MFLLNLALAICNYDAISMLKSASDLLHRLTGLSTFYDFVDVKEDAAIDQIKKALRKFRKAAPPGNLTKEQYEELIMKAYTILTSYRRTYDEFLRDSKFYYLGRVENYKNNAMIIFAAIVCFFVLLDFLYFVYDSFKYNEEIAEYKKSKKEEKKTNKNKKNVCRPVPTMYTKKLLIGASRVFSRKH